MERQVVNFLCEVNQVDVDGRWYRDDCRIRPGDNIKIRHNGRRRKREIKAMIEIAAASQKKLCCNGVFSALDVKIQIRNVAPSDMALYRLILLQVDPTVCSSSRSDQSTLGRSDSPQSESHPLPLSKSKASQQMR